MAVFERETHVDAPLDEVWAFHSTPDGLRKLTPGWMNLVVESVEGPEGEPDPEVLEAGSVIEASVRPFDVGPKQRWRSVITERRVDDGSAYFRDTMDDGPFEAWTHTHSFYADGDGTLVRDRIEYELPLGALGSVASSFAFVGFEPMFRYRHEQTKDLLEGDETTIEVE